MKHGRTAIAARAGLSVETLRKVIEGHIPSPKTAYALAKACEADEETAVAIAKESSSNSAKETA